MDRRLVHLHFRPVRPADIVVSLNPVSRDVDLAARTYGVTSRNPLTIGLHIHRQSYDSQRNVMEAGPGTELVIALPGHDIVYETWITSRPIRRGINEGELGRLTLFPSQLVAPPSIAECPVNLEAVIKVVECYGIHDIVFCRVLGASIAEEYLTMPREDVVRAYPTHECDDVDNPWRGAVERLSVLGEVLPCPQFPRGPRAGRGGRYDRHRSQGNRRQDYGSCSQVRGLAIRLVGDEHNVARGEALSKAAGLVLALAGSSQDSR